tara:strand:+ start:607 stop:837 length:231 start_codon:yes stop_codon:yes gene_type:complete
MLLYIGIGRFVMRRYLVGTVLVKLSLDWVLESLFLPLNMLFAQQDFDRFLGRMLSDFRLLPLKRSVLGKLLRILLN